METNVFLAGTIFLAEMVRMCGVAVLYEGHCLGLKGDSETESAC